MGFMEEVKRFVHSVTTNDHYALYGSPYAQSSACTAVLDTLNGSQANSLISSRNGSSTNIGGYRPGMRSSTNINGISGNDSSTTIHELQNFGANGQVPIPSINSLWDRIERFLETEYPELEDALNSGASTADLNEFEKDLAAGPLSVEIRQFYKRHDGQFRDGKPTGIIMGLPLLDLESIMEEYTLWSNVAKRVEREYMNLKRQQAQLERLSSDALGASSSSAPSADSALAYKIANHYLLHQKSVPLGAVQLCYVHSGWLPISKDHAGNVLAIDLAPGSAGIPGQIILFGRDFDTKVVVASSLQELLFMLVNDFEDGKYQIDHTESYGDNGYLDSSRMNDYMIGDEDEDNGKLMFFDRDGSEFKYNKGQLSYIEVLKRRALKRHGVAHVNHFNTAFSPRRLPKRKPASANASPNPKKGESTLSRDNSTIHLLKETLIDDAQGTKSMSAAGPLKLRNFQLSDTLAASSPNDESTDTKEAPATTTSTDQLAKDLDDVEVNDEPAQSQGDKSIVDDTSIDKMKDTPTENKDSE